MSLGKRREARGNHSSDLGFGRLLKGAKQLWRGEQRWTCGAAPGRAALLAERPGRLVSSEELLKRVVPAST